jgi:hypothetical protein
MVAFGWGSGKILGHGTISFNESVTLYDTDGTVHIRTMNPDGGFYDAQEQLYDDDGSFHLSEVDLDHSEGGGGDDDAVFLDAVEHQLSQLQKGPSREDRSLPTDPLEDDDVGDARNVMPRSSSE